MKLLRYGPVGVEKPGVVDKQGQIRDLSGHLVDFNPQTLGDAGLLDRLNGVNIEQLPLVDNSMRIGPCIGLPGKMICVGFNSALHAQEMGAKPMSRKNMLVFMKPTSSICGPNDPIIYGRYMQKLDWEAELGIIIGKKGKYITKNCAKEYIFGYACVNDLSERFLQLETEDTQFTKAKCFDNSAPIGPYLVTKDEIKNSGCLQISLWVNGERRQHFNSSDYIHNDEAIVSYLSQYFTLYPGDIISMGSAPGSAASWGAGLFLKPNDKVVLAIEGLGQQEQTVVLEK